MQQMPVQQLSGPFSLMVVDAVGPLVTTPRGNKFSLVFADYFTRWVEAFPVAALDTLTFVIVMIDEVISRHGVPENAYLEWTEYGLVISGCVFVIGLGAHVWRLGDLDGRLEQLSPSSVLTDARASVKSSAKARKHQEGTSLRRLRQSEPEEVVLLRDEDDMDNGSGYAATNNVASTERTTTQPSSTTTTATRNTANQGERRLPRTTDWKSRMLAAFSPGLCPYSLNNRGLSDPAIEGGTRHCLATDIPTSNSRGRPLN
ncbi:hypothetical protein PC119_g22188 [Phytophthora cactorum]|nr:hypothetical protein PC119_g22188 [Phytophthora cactorum]